MVVVVCIYIIIIYITPHIVDTMQACLSVCTQVTCRWVASLHFVWEEIVIIDVHGDCQCH